MPAKGPVAPLRKPKEGDPPLIHAWAEVVWWPSPKVLSRNGHRKVQPRHSRVSAHTYRVALVVVDSAVVSPVTSLEVVTSIMDTFLGVNEKPVVPCDGVLDFSTLAGHQC